MDAKKLYASISPKTLVHMPANVIRLVELVPTLVMIIQELQIQCRLKDKELAKALKLDEPDKEKTGV